MRPQGLATQLCVPNDMNLCVCSFVPILILLATHWAAGIVRDKPSAIAMSVSKWWDDYASSKDEAVMQLANMVLEVSVRYKNKQVARESTDFLAVYLRQNRKGSMLATMAWLRELRSHVC